MEKNILRKTVIEKRISLSREEVVLLSDKITEKVILLKEIERAKTVMVYNSIKNEVDTEKLKTYLLKKGKTLVYPIIKNGEMLAAKNLSNEEIVGSFNIKEPKNYEIISDIDVVIVPLVAADKNHNRIGFGKGFYDRFLKDKKIYKIGVCYDFQLVEKIDANPWDIKLDKIITPTQTI